jgi:predicted CXXCH cytochrome family protein
MKGKCLSGVKNLFHKKLILLYVVIFIVSTLFLLNGYSRVRSHGIDDCLACHEDKGLTMDRNGKKISLYVNANDFKKSTHGQGECTDCHINYNPENIPHNPNKKDVNCNDCHGVKHADGSVHTNVKCYSCHGFHTVKPAKEFAAEKSQLCLTCHNTASVNTFKSTIHFKKGINCDNCHNGGHQVVRFTKATGSQKCASCHKKEQIDLKSSAHGKGLSSLKSPVCLDCHAAHGVAGNRYTQETKACMKCHLDAKMFPDNVKGSAKFTAQYETSIHSTVMANGKPAASCSDCHGNHMIQKADNIDVKKKLLETCGNCHKEIVDKFRSSAHGKAFNSGSADAPTCLTCHGEHNIKSVKSEEFSKLKQTDLCLNCHKDGKIKSLTDLNAHTDLYKNSFHYRALQGGNMKAATCTDCHGAHEMKSAQDETSDINKKNVALKTCGKSGCHEKQLSEYTGSVHQVAIANKPKSDSPTCVTCHGNHQVLEKENPLSRISNPKGIVMICSDCHASVELLKNNGLKSGMVESFNESFHGLAVRSGSTTAANCGSCHGNHNIRNSSDTLSSTNKKNLPETCGKCHPGATKTTFEKPIHAIANVSENPLLYWVSLIYKILIVVVIGGMLLHNILDFRKKLITKHKKV